MRKTVEPDTINTPVYALARSPHKGRHKFLVHVPHDEVPTRDINTIITDTLSANASVLGVEEHKEGWADNWARNILRAVRYGIPTADFDGEGFKIVESDMGDPPLCDGCQDA